MPAAARTHTMSQRHQASSAILHWHVLLHELQGVGMGTHRCALIPVVDPDDLDALWCQPKSAAALHHTSSTPASQKDSVRSPVASRDGGGLGKLRVERPSSAASANRPGSPASGASDAEGSAAERTASGSSAGALVKLVPSLPLPPAGSAVRTRLRCDLAIDMDLCCTGPMLSSDDEATERGGRGGWDQRPTAAQLPAVTSNGNGSRHGQVSGSHGASPLGQHLPPRVPPGTAHPAQQLPSGRSMPRGAPSDHDEASGATPSQKQPGAKADNGKMPQEPIKEVGGGQLLPPCCRLLIYEICVIVKMTCMSRLLLLPPPCNSISLGSQAPEDTWAGAREPVEAAANMLITRVAFDLLRAPSFQDAAAAYIQRKLDQLRYPAYIDSLKVYCDTLLVGRDRKSAVHVLSDTWQPGSTAATHIPYFMLPGGGHLRGAVRAGGEQLPGAANAQQRHLAAVPAGHLLPRCVCETLLVLPDMPSSTLSECKLTGRRNLCLMTLTLLQVMHG